MNPNSKRFLSICQSPKVELLKNKAAESGRKILEYFREHGQKLSPLLIVTHDYPDPDALATAYALYYLAHYGFGLKAKIVYGGTIGRVENKAVVQFLKIPAQDRICRERL